MLAIWPDKVEFEEEEPVVLRARVFKEHREPVQNARVEVDLAYPVPVAGQDREWELEEARNPSPPAVLWLARFPAPVAGSDLLLPVRMEVEGTWGAALAHLTVAEIGGQPLIQSAEGGSAPSQMTAAAR